MDPYSLLLLDSDNDMGALKSAQQKSSRIDIFNGHSTIGTGMKLEFQDLTIEQSKESANGTAVEVLCFQGRIHNSNSFDVNRKIHHIFSGNNFNLILDLSELEYINSSGVAMLFSIIYRVKENEGKISIGGLHPFLHNVFNLMDLPPRLKIYDTLEEAREAF